MLANVPGAVARPLPPPPSRKVTGVLRGVVGPHHQGVLDLPKMQHVNEHTLDAALISEACFLNELVSVEST